MSAAAAKKSSPPLTPKNRANGSGPHREEYNTQNEQLVKAWNRIADLETRIHDLTLQATMVLLISTVHALVSWKFSTV